MAMIKGRTSCGHVSSLPRFAALGARTLGTRSTAVLSFLSQ